MTATGAGVRRSAGRSARATTRRTADEGRGNPWLTGSARVGLVARGFLYLVLAGLAVRVAIPGHGRRQADPGGALRLIASEPLGTAAIAVAAAGFAVFAVTRAVAAVAAGVRRELWPTMRAAGEGVVYGFFAGVSVAFLLGDRSTGTQQARVAATARLLGAPAGRVIVAVIGLAVVGAYVAFAAYGVLRGFESRLDEGRMPRPLIMLARVVGPAGFVGRALAFVPVGAFLVVAAVTYDASKAKGLDAVLADAARHWWGNVLLAAVAAGFVSFGCYSGLEAAYRKVEEA